jgi:hypothetical protein
MLLYMVPTISAAMYGTGNTQSFAEGKPIQIEETGEWYDTLAGAIKAAKDVEALKKMLLTLKEEHHSVGHIMDQAEDMLKDHKLPADACMSYQNLYATLGQIFDDTHMHIHIENNILFKRLLGDGPSCKA